MEIVEGLHEGKFGDVRVEGFNGGKYSSAIIGDEW